MKMRPTDSGFTLIELVVVLLILGIIAGIAIVAFGNSHKTSVQGACKTNFQATSLAIQSYQSENDGAVPESLISMAPDFINSNLIDNGKFTLLLQTFPSSYSIGVINTLGLTVKNAVLNSISNGAYTFFVGDTSKISEGQDVYGTGLGSLVSAIGTYTSNTGTILMENADGLSVGMSVTGVGIPSDTTITAIDLTQSIVTISKLTTASGSSAGLIFGVAPKVAPNGIKGDGTVVIAGDGSIHAPKVGSKYTLVFGGQQLPGVAPTACLSL